MGGGKMNWGKVNRAKRVSAGRGKEPLPILPCFGCWCGKPSGHDWPGREDGQPHPREETQE